MNALLMKRPVGWSYDLPFGRVILVKREDSVAMVCNFFAVGRQMLRWRRRWVRNVLVFLSSFTAEQNGPEIVELRSIE